MNQDTEPAVRNMLRQASEGIAVGQAPRQESLEHLGRRRLRVRRVSELAVAMMVFAAFSFVWGTMQTHRPTQQIAPSGTPVVTESGPCAGTYFGIVQGPEFFDLNPYGPSGTSTDMVTLNGSRAAYLRQGGPCAQSIQFSASPSTVLSVGADGRLILSQGHAELIVGGNACAPGLDGCRGGLVGGLPRTLVVKAD
ncbi:hypothetical protein GCM10027600_24370 [Nocardioides ginsengisegetis]